VSEPKVTGTVHFIDEVREYGSRGFRKRLVVLEQEDGRWSNYIPLELLQEDVSLADQLTVGDEIEATYRLRGRKWQPKDGGDAKWFISAEAFDLKVVGHGEGPPADADGDPGFEPNDDEVPF